MLDQSPTFGDCRLPPRFWAKVNPSGRVPAHRPELGCCWEWIGATNRAGYGQFEVGTFAAHKVRGAHRVAYEALNGVIPEGLQCDHLCRNRACVNPAHIEPVTNRENARRGLNGLLWAPLTHCLRGHPYNTANTYWYLTVRGQPARKCRECGRYRKMLAREKGQRQ